MTVRRHNLPDTNVVWPVDTRSSPTVYRLLELVNEAIPIESGEQWGFEDYVVQVRGKDGVNYDCLHFIPVTNCMKDEDEIL